MTRAVLYRLPYNAKATQGVLTLDDKPLCVTLEDPWRNNQRNISCIPAGVYECVPHNGVRFKDVWVLKNVPDRSYILIHAGNSVADTQGCILVGKSFNAHTIRDSRMALDSLRIILPDRFTLDIREYGK